MTATILLVLHAEQATNSRLLHHDSSNALVTAAKATPAHLVEYVADDSAEDNKSISSLLRNQAHDTSTRIQTKTEITTIPDPNLKTVALYK